VTGCASGGPAGHRLFWPFDFGPSPAAQEARPALHLPDPLRIGVVAGEEGARLRLQAHLMGCPLCRDRCLALWELRAAKARGTREACTRARAAALRFLEQGRALGEGDILHLVACPFCRDDFLGPAAALFIQEVDKASIAPQG
jgi:uncharacterized protein YbaR (Trm112 family)